MPRFYSDRQKKISGRVKKAVLLTGVPHNVIGVVFFSREGLPA